MTENMPLVKQPTKNFIWQSECFEEKFIKACIPLDVNYMHIFSKFHLGKFVHTLFPFAAVHAVRFAANVSKH